MGWFDVLPPGSAAPHLEDGERIDAVAQVQGRPADADGYRDGRRDLRGRLVLAATDRRLLAFRAGRRGRAGELVGAVLYAELDDVVAGRDVPIGGRPVVPITLVDLDGAEVVVVAHVAQEAEALVAHVRERLAARVITPYGEVA